MGKGYQKQIEETIHFWNSLHYGLLAFLCIGIAIFFFGAYSLKVGEMVAGILLILMGGFCLIRLQIPFTFTDKKFHCAQGTIVENYTVPVIGENAHSHNREEYIMGEVLFPNGKLFHQPVKLKRRKIDSLNEWRPLEYRCERVLVIEFVKGHVSAFVYKRQKKHEEKKYE